MVRLWWWWLSSSRLSRSVLRPAVVQCFSSSDSHRLTGPGRVGVRRAERRGNEGDSSERFVSRATDGPTFWADPPLRNDGGSRANKHRPIAPLCSKRLKPRSLPRINPTRAHGGREGGRRMRAARPSAVAAQREHRRPRRDRGNVTEISEERIPKSVLPRISCGGNTDRGRRGFLRWY